MMVMMLMMIIIILYEQLQSKSLNYFKDAFDTDV
jgi:hypothetical protein